MPNSEVKVRILGWQYVNIRGLQTMNVSLEQDLQTPYPITLIMMPNGQGKTTTMELLTAALTGAANQWSPDKVRQFRPQDSQSTSGAFDLRLLVDDRQFVIALHLNYHEGTVSYTSTKVEVHGGGQEPGFILPTQLKDVFTKEFVKRFIFDGELVRDILEATKDEAEKTIRYLYNLDRLDQLAIAIDQVKQKQQEAAERTASKTDQGVARWRTVRDKAKQQMEDLRAQQAEVQKQLAERKQNLEDTERFLGENLAKSQELKTRFDDCQQRLDTVRQQIDQRSEELIEGFRDPAMASRLIAERLNTLSNHLLRLKLPESTSRQFFLELADENVCVCGRPIGDTERQAILTRAGNYLGHDEYGVVNAIKHDILHSQFDGRLDDTISALDSLLNEENQLQTDLLRIQLEQQETGDEEVQQAIKRKGSLQTEINDLRRTNEQLTNELEAAQMKFEEAQRSYEEATRMVTFIRAADQLKRYTVEVTRLALDNLKASIIENTNRRISDLIRLEEIAVEAIDGHLKLRDRAGASQGQSLAIAYAFLGSLFSGAAFGLPFVVDSPANSIDLAIRREVAKMLPGLFEQLILLIMSGEREGFCNPFYDRPDTLFLTVVKDQAGTTCVPGVDTFIKFQSDEEER